MMFNVDGRIEMVNAQAERIFGYSETELLNRHVDMLVPERHRARFPSLVPDAFKETRSKPSVLGETFMGLHKDGHEFEIDVGSKSIEINGGCTMLASVLDVSERMR
jgi:PAS domain S-box-containing protein